MKTNLNRREFVKRTTLATVGSAMPLSNTFGSLNFSGASKVQTMPPDFTINGRIPISLIIDDPMPGLNLMYLEDPKNHPDPFIPNKLIKDTADLFEEFGTAGKFSVVPMQYGRGRIDKHIDGISDQDLAEFLQVVKTRIEPLYDITPEILSHFKAYNLATGNYLDEREDAYFTHISRETMTDYISLSLEILKNAGIDANGVTSPWTLGKEKEIDYSLAILEAQKRVHGRSRTWYFLHADPKYVFLPHCIMHRPVHDEWVVSIFSGGFDFAWQTQDGKPGLEDAMISADGKSGRLMEMFRGGSSVVFHTHWQSLYSKGTYAGLISLRRVFERVKQHLGDKIIWTKCSRLAERVAEANS